MKKTKEASPMMERRKAVLSSLATPAQIVEKHALTLEVRGEIKLDDGRTLAPKFAIFQDGMVLGSAGRLVSEKKFVDHFTSTEGGKKALLTKIQAQAYHQKMVAHYQKLGGESIKKTMEAVEAGSRVVTQWHWDFIKGTNVIRTKAVDDKARYIEVAGSITEVNGKPVSSQDAKEFARLLLEKGGDLKK